MMSEKVIDLNKIREEYNRFPDVFESVLMATVNAEGIPDVSYAAYLAFNGDYYIYVSELSLHTQNLMESGQISLLFIENEDRAKHLFARQRMTLQCESIEVFRGSVHFETIMEKFSGKFGKFMDMLKSLNDFHMFKITPLRGSYVRGFAQAFKLEGKGLSKVSHINDKGHQSDNPQTEKKMSELEAS